ncbi:unannotated protein [freshwater metagenome]|uniref:Unannotated protein n=1 Tax=freshwater metagenome TaxID=449393 RepID=A0A6J7IWQ2_9ZZZZ
MTAGSQGANTSASYGADAVVSCPRSLSAALSWMAKGPVPTTLILTYVPILVAPVWGRTCDISESCAPLV